jgi:hypothetical protein
MKRRGVDIRPVAIKNFLAYSLKRLATRDRGIR